MMRFTKSHRAHRLLPCAASVLTLSLIATLKIEHSCSQEPRPQPQTSPSLIYPYPEILSTKEKNARIAVSNSILWESNIRTRKFLAGAD